MKKLILSLCIMLSAGGILPAFAGPLTEGYYVLDAPFFYKRGLCLVEESESDRYAIKMLERRGGSFELKYKEDGRLKIVNDEISFDKIRRSLKGDGKITGPNQAEGKGVSWIKTIGFFSRNHHKGTWKLTPASSKEVARKIKRLRETTGLDLPDF